MIKAIAIDDEPQALKVIENHAAKISFLTLLRTFTNPFEALAFVHEHKVDLIFLDIRMPDISGMDLLRTMGNGKFIIVFTTAHSEYALVSYELEALDYLLKPFDFSRFLRSVVKAQEKLALSAGPANDFFFVNTGHQQLKISFSDIKYIEGNGNYVTYYTQDDKILVRSTIKDTLKILPPGLFIQIHRSSIVSLKRLDKIQDNHAFIGNHRISIGASYRDALMKLIGSRGALE